MTVEVTLTLLENLFGYAKRLGDATQRDVAAILAELQQRGRTTGLNEAERYELLALLQIYQIGQLRKSEALAEAVGRGLRSHERTYS